MISRVAVVPHPPLLVPELAAGAAQTTPVREACLAAVRALVSVVPEWIAVGAGKPMVIEPGTRGSFRGYGADVPATLSERLPDSLPGRPCGTAAPVSTELPLPSLIAGWLRERAGAASVRVHVIDPASPASDCADLGRRLDRNRDEAGLLILADGSNRHGERAPGGHDDRAAGFDAVVRDALERADTEVLASLDPVLAHALGAGGWAPWQVLAGLAGAARWRADLLYSAAPFGVGYHVAVWERR